MGHAGKLEGEVVGEETVANGLGFANVAEFRRWQTEIGKENAELKYALAQAKNEGNRFRWHGLRMQVVLDKIEEWLKKLNEEFAKDTPNDFLKYVTDNQKHVDKLLLAIAVVSGREADWNHVLKDWFDPVDEKCKKERCDEPS